MDSFLTHTLSTSNLHQTNAAWWTEQRLKKYREKAEISRFKPFEHEIRWRGYTMATENQQARINDVIEVKTSVYLYKT